LGWTERQTDGHFVTAQSALYIALRGKINLQ